MTPKTDFVVLYADWEPTDLMPFPLTSREWKEATPSNRIDDRTVRAYSFEEEEAAVQFAEHMIGSQIHSEWLAYCEIEKRTSERIHKLK